MEAKDTVKKGNIEASVFCIGFTGDANEWSACTFWEMATQLALDQAEISFKAGVEQGRREVVEWLIALDQEIGAERVCDTDGVYSIKSVFKPIIFTAEWQAKLKEWHI